MNRLPLVVSCAALVVAVLGSTGLGRAAVDAVVPVPLAKRAYLADTARNSIKLNGIRANRTPTAGMLVPLASDGKFPATVGAIGPAGPAGPVGPKGSKGDPGLAGWVVVQGAPQALAANGKVLTRVSCPAGKKVLGGGGHQASSVGAVAYMDDSTPIDGVQWQAGFINTSSTPATVWAYAVCATVLP